ncbi:uncharacterized protein PHACADRAFT_252993 [Phanerochaete carnosa HHB-10118-sp]|uniref:Uncharacterized protein n=1 Tax=Phanerochaete carnosa (strain HHB-10118-sp) TaxID=650164 RepID=K5V730_PHACS|nr:uncharacterized protein PHACADRAFT_252993 [Phanerochaete carnosa HHB-10118-sp]EKM58556.1 hypothetical protein PHACADRAFT_252993 [Phanerochaete carnosa HHB-10118-sp]
MSPEAFATMLWKMKTKWPPRGQLIVEMNTHRESRAAWLPKQMGPDDGPIDVTPYIAPGDNIIRFVQLSGQADRLFVLYVGRPDGERANSPATNGWDSWLSSLGLQS